MRATLSLQSATLHSWDVIVIGAGPAGCVAATALAGHGLRILLVEARAFPRSKVCGGCLNLASLSLLRSSGVLGQVEALGAPRLSEFAMAAGGRSLSLELPGGTAVSRSALDETLARAAAARGAHFLAESTAVVGEVESDQRGVALTSRGQTVVAHTRVTVAAAGLGSQCLSRLEGFAISERANSRIGVEVMLDDYPSFYHTGTIFMAVGKSGYVGLTRVEGDRLNVAAALDRHALRSSGSPASACEETLREAGFPPLSPHMNRAEWRGTVGLTRRSARRAAERLFVIGDAAGYVEPITGEGMAWALSSGLEVVAFALEGLAGGRSDVAQRWEMCYDRLIGRRQWLCRALAAGLRHPRLLELIIPLLSGQPSLTQPLVRRLNREYLAT